MLNIVSFEELYSTEFNLHFFIAGKQYWNNRYSFSCIGAPKPNDMLLYLKGCAGEYILEDGSVLTARKNSIVYAPKGSQYIFRPLDVDKDSFSTIIVNFTLFHETGEGFILSDGIKIIENPNYTKFEVLFTSLAEASAQNLRFPAALKAELYRIISELCRHYHTQNILSTRFQVISKGILYLEESEDMELPVSEIAKMCSVSEIYFRKLFKQYSGVTPVQFKINKKLERAKQYLALEGKTVKETANALGFVEEAYFCRVFKKKTGVTPGEFIERFGGNGV